MEAKQVIQSIQEYTLSQNSPSKRDSQISLKQSKRKMDSNIIKKKKTIISPQLPIADEAEEQSHSPKKSSNIFEGRGLSKFSQIVQAAIAQNMLNRAKGKIYWGFALKIYIYSYQENTSEIQREKDNLTYKDFLFFRILLDINIDDADIRAMYNSNKNVKRFKQIISMDEQSFLQAYLSDKQLNEEFNIMSNYLLSFLDTFIDASLKMKALLRAESRLHSSLILEESFSLICEETCKVLECDRASVFLLDKQKEELWTKSSVGTKNIRISMKSGIAGFVANTGKNINIVDAQIDKRFNSDIDRLTNYKTRSVLCVPIKDADQKHIIGVIQAINKNHGFFTKDDEGLILLLSFMASGVFINCLYHDSKTVIQHILKKLIQAGLSLNKSRSIKELIYQSEQFLKNELDTCDAKVQFSPVYFDQIFLNEKKNLIRFENDKTIQYETNSGIVGYVNNEDIDYFTVNSYSDPNFNQIVDINTKMPTLTIPLKLNENSVVSFDIIYKLAENRYSLSH